MQSPLTKEPGTLIDGRYEIESLLGVGGMSSVYRVRDAKMNRVVALKMLHPHITEHRSSAERFLQEAKAEALIHHPNVIRVHAVNVTQPDGQLYIIMDYLQGESLADLIKGGPLKDDAKALELFLQTCRGLEAAHEQGVVHRDLKPSNVMLVDNGQTVKLVDFGIATLFQAHNREQRLTKEGAVLGSPEYMSPEQCEGQDVDVRSDIYSMGCLMYEMLTGVVPFQGDNQIEIMCKHVAEPAPHLDSPFDSVIAKCLQKDPSARYQSIGALIQALEELDLTEASAVTVERSYGRGVDERRGSASRESRPLLRALRIPLTVGISTIALAAIGFITLKTQLAPAPHAVAPQQQFKDEGEYYKATLADADKLWMAHSEEEATETYDRILAAFANNPRLLSYTEVTRQFEHVVERASGKSVSASFTIATKLLYYQGAVGQSRGVALVAADLAKRSGVPLTCGHDLIIVAECDAIQGRVDFALQSVRDAIESYKQAPDLDGGTFPGLSEVGRLLHDNQEHHIAAARVAEMAYGLAKHVESPADESATSYEAAFSYWRAADYAHAAPWFDKCLAVRSKLFRQTDPEVYLTQFDAGSTYQKLGKNAEAKRYFDKCRPQLEKLAHDRPGPEINRKLAQLADFYSSIGQNKVAGMQQL